MRVNIVQKTIDLSHYKSYYPSIIPYFRDGELVIDTTTRPNQGYYVSDIEIPGNIANNINVQTDVNILLKKGEDDYYAISDKPDLYARQLFEEGNTEQIYYFDKDGEYYGIFQGTPNENGVEGGSTHVKYASFQTLVIWYRFFKRYYDALYTLRCDGEVYQFRTTDPEYVITNEMEELYNNLGGEATYNWLKEILEPRYDVNIDIDFNYFYTSLTWWDIQYHLRLINSTLAKIAELDDPAACCLREKLYAHYGGEENFNKIYAWLQAQTAPSFNGTATGVASINIPLTISCDFDLIGEKTALYEDWLAGEEYGSGSYIRYNDDVYIKQSGDSFKYNEEQRYIEFESGSYKNSCEQYVEDYQPEDVALSGQTESKLNDFVDVKRCYDVMGNDMHGKFLEDTTSAGPTEDNVQLDLQYHIYNVCNLEKLDIPYIFEEEKYYKVFGNILTGIKIYLQSATGEIIDEYELEWNKDSENVSKIEEFLERANDSADTTSLCDGNLYAEFKYVMGTTLMLTGSKEECHYDIDPESQNDGVFYTDRKIITRESEVYQASTNSSYIIYYFNVEAAEQKTIRNTLLNTIMVYDMCDYQTTVRYNGDNSENAPMIYTPLTALEYRFGTTSLQHVDSDVYVQRGVSAALEKYIAMGSIQTFEALENYQNSNINIINSNQE